jgi:AraC family transcriptional regulator
MDVNQAEEYAKRILKVLVFVEEHLDGELNTDDLAKVACYSPFHFHRVFQMIVGESVYQYVKRLRIEKAASRLVNTSQSVTEIALGAHYDTPSAFTKAFKQWMGESPKSFRTLYTAAASQITKTFKDLPMYQPDQITQIADLPVLFIRRTGSYEKTPQETWQALLEFINSKPGDHTQLRYFGIPHDNPSITEEAHMRYDACVSGAHGLKPHGEVGQSVIKGGKYAIFTHKGSYDGLKDAFASIYLKWLPENKARHDASRPPFTEYLEVQYKLTDPSKLITKLYIPLK